MWPDCQRWNSGKSTYGLALIPSRCNKNPYEAVRGRAERASREEGSFGSKIARASTESPLVLLTLIEREALKRAANLLSRGKPDGGTSPAVKC